MKQTTEKMIKKYAKECAESALSYDINRFRAFYQKWQEKGFCDMPLPKDDKVIELTMRKIVCETGYTTKEQKEEAQKWLAENGSGPIS